MKLPLYFFTATTGLFLSFLPGLLPGQITPVGSGSYTKTFPGTDIAGRNSYPSGTPYVSGIAASKPIPTNDWWSSKIKQPHVNNIFNYPLALRTINEGLVLSYIVPASGPNGSSQPMDDIIPVISGVTGLNAAAATVSDFSDFTFTMNWSNNTHSMNATVGLAMPFIYFSCNQGDVAQITVNEGNVSIQGEMLVIENSHQGADFAVYAPAGSTWTQSGKTFTSLLNGKNYWSVAYLPPSASNMTEVANEYKKYAYVFPVNTLTRWSYDENRAVLRTTFEIDTEVKEGSDTTFLLGLLPHQWGNLAADSPAPDSWSYPCIRGLIKTLATNEFHVENTFHGILPTLPYLNNYSEGFSPANLNRKVQLLENEALSTWTDSYNEGQVMNRLIQTARIADLAGNTTARDKIIATIRERLEDWLKAETGEIAFLFYYNSTWTALIGYPAGHGQDNNLNDHHFHWGYFIHAAAFLEQYQPGWADGWGGMINYLVRDAASPDRNDPLFPYLRNFSPYAGHCWANGFATFPFGNDQESTSESMQFNSSLIHWGAITGNKKIRDLGIYLYTTEQTAIEEYWFDIHKRNFKDGYGYSLASRIWGNGYDNQTFWTSDIAAVYGIEMYPIHGGSLYLGHPKEYAAELWKEITGNTGILSNQANPNLWHDVLWKYLAFTDPKTAIGLYDSYPGRDLKFGISDAQTYYWLHSMNALGTVDTAVRSGYPLSAVFTREGLKTYVAQNYSGETITVNFSDGYSLSVPPRRLATSRDISLSGSLKADFPQSFPGNSTNLEATVTGGQATKVAFFDGETMVGETTSPPYKTKVESLTPGKHDFYAKIYEDTAFAITNIYTLVVGRQLPFGGNPSPVPGIIEAGNYDEFDGGNGQDISYSDVSLKNEGDYRINESVDATLVPGEGATIGWIAPGEWLEYTVDVKDPGLYSLNLRYACGNTSGGGPLYIQLDGKTIIESTVVGYTGGWSKWASKTINNIPLPGGEHVLRLTFEGGELNIGKMIFDYKAVLPYSQPVADAGDNITVLLPGNTATLDGSRSSDPGLVYEWTQVYGPSVAGFSSAKTALTQAGPLVEGVYYFRLEVSNGSYSDEDYVFVIVSATGKMPPSVKINSPMENDEFIEGKSLYISAGASDLDGNVVRIDFYANDTLIGTVSTTPFTLEWIPASKGGKILTAVATDDDGMTASSSPVTIFVTQAPPCNGSSLNGDFQYEFSDDASNPTLTFIPSKSGVGSPTCILYYGTNPSGPYPGYNVTPNNPFRISAGEGQTVYFYYTYSYPGAGERNSSADKSSYVVGTCKQDQTGTEDFWGGFNQNGAVRWYPNPVEDILHLQYHEPVIELMVYNPMGKLVHLSSPLNQTCDLDMSAYPAGLYFVVLHGASGVQGIRVVKR